MRAAAVALACLPTCVLVACSFLVSTGGLSDGPPLVEERDDVRTTDSPADVLGDGGSAGEAGSFCTQRGATAVFCADFDHSIDVADGFSHHLVNGATAGGVSELDRSILVSPPASAHLSVPSSVPGVQNGLVNRLTWFPSSDLPAAKSFHFECRLRVDAVDTQETAFLVALDFGEGSIGVPLTDAQAHSLSLQTSGTRGQLVETDPPNGTRTTTALTTPVGTWTLLEIDVTYDAAPAMVTITFDGKVALQRDLAQGYSPIFHELSAGIQYYTTATVAATSVHLDDILVEVR